MFKTDRKKYLLFRRSLVAVIVAALLLQPFSSALPTANAAMAQQEPTPVPFDDEGSQEVVSTPRIYIPMLSLPSQQASGQNDPEDQSNPDLGYSETETEAGVNAESGVMRQGELAAQADDVGRLASEAGLSTDKVASAIAFQQAFSRYADELIERYPDQISSVRMEPVPNQRGYLQFVDTVPEEVTVALSQPAPAVRATMAQNNVVLTAENIVVIGGGRLSIAEHTRRAELAALALADQGYRNSAAFFSPIDNKLHVEVLLPEDVEQPSRASLANVVQDRLQVSRMSDDGIRLDGESAIVNDEDIDLTIVTGTEPIVTRLHSRGGNWLRLNGRRLCTSGWSVRSWYGSYGIMTAGHCGALNQFEQPGVPLYSMRLIRRVFDRRGDVEYLTTSHWELAEFYASANQIRAVTGVRRTNSMVGASVCSYGRTSNVRTCNHTVEAVGLFFTADGKTTGNHARASNNSLRPGDSGGGWSWGNTAWGVSTGVGYGKSYFSTLQEAQRDLRVTVLTK